jgi:hypothetical protein
MLACTGSTRRREAYCLVAYRRSVKACSQHGRQSAAPLRILRYVRQRCAKKKGSHHAERDDPPGQEEELRSRDAEHVGSSQVLQLTRQCGGMRALCQVIVKIDTLFFTSLQQPSIYCLSGTWAGEEHAGGSGGRSAHPSHPPPPGSAPTWVEGWRFAIIRAKGGW